MQKLFDFLKGLPIGIANVIPGFSGGTMAVILNIYERFINAFSEFFSHPIRVIKDVWALFLGIVVGIIMAITVMGYLLVNFPVPTSMFFVGLIIGSIPQILEKTKSAKVRVLDVIIFFVSLTLVVIMPLMKSSDSEQIDNNLKSYLILLVVSIIAASTMVIPGVSGSMMLLVLGYYHVVFFEIVRGFLNALRVGDLSLVFSILPKMAVVGIGGLLGIIFISKLIKLLLEKSRYRVYYAILGLLFASPFAIIYGMYQDFGEKIRSSNLISWIIGFFMLIIGTSLVIYLTKYEKVNNNEQDQKS